MLDQSATDESTSPIVTYVFEENVTDIEIVSSSRLSPPGSHVLKDHNYVSAFRSKQSMCKTTAITVKGKKSPFIYQVNWEKNPRRCTTHMCLTHLAHVTKNSFVGCIRQMAIRCAAVCVRSTEKEKIRMVS